MKIPEILKNQTITTQFDFSGSCPNKDGNTVTFEIFNTAFFINEIMHNYFNRLVFTDLDNAFTDFISVFNSWKLTRGPMYARMMYAYSLGYNPIENYSSIETMDRTDEVTYLSDMERTHNQDKIERTYNQDKIERTYNQDKIERTYNNDELERSYTQYQIQHSHTNDKETTTYTNLTDSHDHSKYGVNSSNAVAVSNDTDTRNGSFDVEYTGSDTEGYSGSYADTHTGGYNDEHTGGYNDEHSGGYEDEHTGGYKDSHTGTDTTDIDYTLTKSGNIGIQTASEMTQKLYDGLVQDLQQRALKEFLDKYSFYDGNVEEVILW